MADLGSLRRIARAEMRDLSGAGRYIAAQATIGTLTMFDNFIGGSGALNTQPPDKGSGTWQLRGTHQLQRNSGAANVPAAATDGLWAAAVIEADTPTDPDSEFWLSAALELPDQTAVCDIILAYRTTAASAFSDTQGTGYFNDGFTWKFGHNIAGGSGIDITFWDGATEVRPESRSQVPHQPTATASADIMVAIHVKGSQHTCWLNGVQVGSYTTANVRSTNTHIGIGVRANNALVHDSRGVELVAAGDAPVVAGAVSDVEEERLALAPLRAGEKLPIVLSSTRVGRGLTWPGQPNRMGLTLLNPDSGAEVWNTGQQFVDATEPRIWEYEDDFPALHLTDDSTSSGVPLSGLHRLGIYAINPSVTDGFTIYSEGTGTSVPAGWEADHGRCYAVARTTLTPSVPDDPSGIDLVFPEQKVVRGSLTHPTQFTAFDVKVDTIQSASVVETTSVVPSSGNLDLPVIGDLRYAAAGVGVRFTAQNSGVVNNNEPEHVWESPPAGWRLSGDDNHILESSSTGSSFTEDAFTADPEITVHSDPGGGSPGVLSFADAARTVPNRVFRRRQPTQTDHAIPYLRAWVYNARGPLASTPVRAITLTQSDSSTRNNQPLTTSAAGLLEWSYTIADTAPAFSRYVRPMASRVSGSHVSLGPDDPDAPPAVFAEFDSDYPALFPGPVPAYPRAVRILGNVSGANNPSVTENDQFGVSSEIEFEDMWTGTNASKDLDNNGVPSESGTREQQLGAGSLKAKLTTLIDEGSVRVIDPTRHNPKDVAGRKVLVTDDNLYKQRALWNATEATVSDPGTPGNDGKTALDNALGYNDNNGSLDTIDPPADSATLTLYHGFADLTVVRDSFLLEESGSLPRVGFGLDQGNFGYRGQDVAFAALDSSLKLLLFPTVIQSDATLTRRYVVKVIRLTRDPAEPFVNVDTDSPPIYVAYVLPETGPATLFASGEATPIGPTPTGDYEFTITVPTGYKAMKVYASAVVAGARTIGGDVQAMQIGYEFDAVAFAVGLPFK